jgi:hypothetical protein
MIAASIGRSEAGKRIHEAGMAYQRSVRDAEEQERAKREFERYLAAVFAAAKAKQEPKPAPPVTIRSIIAATAERHGLTYNDIRAFSRSVRLVAARFEAMYEAAVQTQHSLVAIGHAFGRDHTTVINAIRRHCERNGLDMPRGLTWRPLPKSSDPSYHSPVHDASSAA